jgi:glycosyltransferase involved in cell wall biosynthesis
MDVTQQTEAPIAGNTRVILNIGKYEAQKGQDVLIRAFAEVGLDYKDIELILVGATDKALESLKTLSQELGVIDRVQFIQDVSFQEIPKYYRRATIFCLPSKKEGFPLVLLEAARFRVPIIASHVGGIPELISSGENGMLVSPDNPSELASSLRLYLSQPVVAREMADRLFKIVELDFTWKKVYEKYEKLY